MNSPLILPFTFCFLILFHGCLADQFRPSSQQQKKKETRLRGSWECQIERISAREPNHYVKSEAGESHYWIPEPNDEFECAGVEAVRHTIYPKGLLLPYYTTAPELAYVVQGEGFQGTVLPGCPETFQTSFPSEGGKEGFFDEHQKVYRYTEGDILALPGGAVHWTYNPGNTPIIVIVLRDTGNVANQLDQNFRKFFLAGNPQNAQAGGEKLESLNIFNGFGDKILQEVFKVRFDTVRQLKGDKDDRGLIVEANDFQVVIPQQEEQSSSRSTGGGGNGIEETMCSAQLSADIASPITADVYNPRGGRLNSLNSNKLPILKLLQLSAQRGVLYKNALLAPHYNLNSHSLVYILSGSIRVQIVQNNGSPVFDDVVRQGQLIVVPQNFAVMAKAEEQGCEWVAFKTNDNAITTHLAGRLSFVRAVPVEVLQNSYDISIEQADSLKNNRQEGVVLSPSSGSTGQKARSAMLNALFG